MSTNLLTALELPLSSLANSTPVGNTEIPAKVDEIWQNAWSDYSKEGSGGDQQVELVKGVLEVVSRELTVGPLSDGSLLEPTPGSSVEEKQAFQGAIQCRLDMVLALFESAYESLQNSPAIETGAMFLPLLEELVELISVESWRELWGFVETRSKRFTKDMPASRGKALPLLRTINAFLRFLPRTPEGLVFRGRIHQFASSVISIADKSAINLRGDYNDLKTVWEEDQTIAEAEVVVKDSKSETKGEKGDADGDIRMEGEDAKEFKGTSTAEAESKDTKAESESDFYSTLWSLQQYFAHPPSLAPSATAPAPRTPAATKGETAQEAQTPFAMFREKSDLVLPILFEQTKKQRELMGRESETTEGGGKKRKRSEGGTDSDFFYPRYLTGKRLLEHELADPSFRRQILVQYFILFQFLLHLTPATASKQAFTGGMPKNFVIEAGDESWVKEKVSMIREELRKMPVDGVRFEKTVLSIITREFHYSTWKNEGCPEGVFDVPPLDKGSAEERATLWKRRLAPPRRFKNNLGTMALSDMWRGGYSDVDQLKNWKRKSDVASLYEEIKAIDADEEDDKAMGDVAPEKLTQNEERRTSMTWRALRQRTQTDIRSCTALKDKRDLHLLFRKPTPKPTVDIVVGAGGGDGQEAAKQEEETKEEEEEEDVAADTSAAVEVKAEDTAITVKATAEVVMDETTTTTEAPGQEASTMTSMEEVESKPVAEDDGWPKSDVPEVQAEVESGGMDVDRPATPEPEGIPAPDLEPAEAR